MVYQLDFQVLFDWLYITFAIKLSFALICHTIVFVNWPLKWKFTVGSPLLVLKCFSIKNLIIKVLNQIFKFFSPFDQKIQTKAKKLSIKLFYKLRRIDFWNACSTAQVLLYYCFKQINILLGIMNFTSSSQFNSVHRIQGFYFSPLNSLFNWIHIFNRIMDFMKNYFNHWIH